MASHPAHPKVFAGGTLALLIVLSVLGAIIGVQLLTTLGVTPNTAIIGAMVAMIIARIPLKMFAQYRSIHVQNLAQSVTSAATFGAANSLLMPISLPFLFNRSDLIIPVLVGVSFAMLLDGYLLYRLFDTRVFPASGAWPPGVAAAEAIKAGDTGGKEAFLLLGGITAGVGGALMSIPMSAFGTAFLGNIWALTMFGIGLLSRGYSLPLFDIDINGLYLPHGLMIGAGIVALFQVIVLIRAHPQNMSHNDKKTAETSIADVTRDADSIKRSLRLGAAAYLILAVLLAIGTGLYTEMSFSMLVAFTLYAAFAAFVHELIVGIAAMHSGWFPAFAVALITLLIGMMLGFPPLALVVLCSFSSATGPAFADMGYDLKAGYMLRGNAEDIAFELDGRRQQLIGVLMAFAICIPVVFLSFNVYFSQGLVPPVAKVYIATIEAGIAEGVAWKLALWAIPGAVIQLIGGSKRQLGVLLSTGLLIPNPWAGWAVLTGIVLRLIITRIWGEKARSGMEVFAAGTIAGDALYSFFNSLFKAGIKGR